MCLAAGWLVHYPSPSHLSPAPPPPHTHTLTHTPLLHTCSLAPGRSEVYTWGWNRYLQCGEPASKLRVLPLLVDTSHTDRLVLASICGGCGTVLCLCVRYARVA